MIRAQYYFRQSDRGLLAWDVRRLIQLSQNLPVENVGLEEISELDETHWYLHEGDSPTCRSILEHMALIDEADLSHPIVLDEDGRVMDGMHRVCKAVRVGKNVLLAVRFGSTPEPDFIGCDPADLPYDD